jgi:dCTP deaminase
MSLMNDRWIREMCTGQGRFPEPRGWLLKPLIEPYVDKQVGDGVVSYGPSSFGYDLRAGYDWMIFTDIFGAIVDPKKPDDRAFQKINMGGSSEPIIIPPNSYALTHTLEYIVMPHNVTGLCIGKSTYARCGIHVNITPLEAGWEGQITVEISNATRLPVKIYPGEGIMQVLFFKGKRPDVSYADRKGKYQNQKGITLASILPKEGPRDR